LSVEPAPELPASVELPLFWSPAATPSRVPDRGDEEPLITRAAPPRPPLSVRRATPEVPRLRPNASRAPTLDLAFDEADTLPSIRIGAVPRPGLLVRPRAAPATAGLVSRLVAVAIDVALLAGIDLAVLYFTMKICGLEPHELSLLPVAPLVAFLLAQNGSYLVAFTAGGQTLGKMATGIRVVGHDHAEPLDLGQAFRRSFWWMVLAAPAGLGFLTALSGRERRGLHDRLAGTRVVRVAAS
jgi:uncharacterized RDD family membrane protein YckC